MRALTKAGLSDLKVLKSATIEQLTAVPGMSEIKARQIQSFLADFTEEALDYAARAANESGQTSENQQCSAGLAVGADEVRVRLASAPALDADIVREGEQAFNTALRLLLTEAATGYRARLLRETLGFMHLVKALLQCSMTEAKAQERAVKRLQAVNEALADAISGPDMDRKAQTRLADELAQACDRLEHLIGQTLRRRTTETDDE